MTAKEVKAFHNTLFFDENGRPRAALAQLTIRAGNLTLTIPAIEIRPDHTLSQAIRAYYEFLSASDRPGVVPLEDQPQKEAVQETPFLNVEQLEYRNNTYLVEERSGEEFLVRNQESGKEISPKSPVYKALVKRYKKSLPSSDDLESSDE